MYEENIPSCMLKTEKHWSTDKLSSWQTTWLLQVCGKMLYLPALILTIDGTIGHAKRGTWCQDVRHQMVMLQYPYVPMLML